MKTFEELQGRARQISCRLLECAGLEEDDNSIYFTNHKGYAFFISYNYLTVKKDDNGIKYLKYSKEGDFAIEYEGLNAYDIIEYLYQDEQNIYEQIEWNKK